MDADDTLADHKRHLSIHDQYVGGHYVYSTCLLLQVICKCSERNMYTYVKLYESTYHNYAREEEWKTFFIIMLNDP